MIIKHMASKFNYLKTAGFKITEFEEEIKQ
jgi:hypothetical protein